MVSKYSTVEIKRWQGSQHPSLNNIMRIVKDEGLRPYSWDCTPNYRYAVRSHNYHKTLFVTEGTLEITFPDSNQRITLRGGDRIDIPANVRHGMNSGNTGARCIEASRR